jgi:hypothetical protein
MEEKEKENISKKKHEHECMEEYKLDKRTNLVSDKSFFLFTIATSFDTKHVHHG